MAGDRTMTAQAHLLREKYHALQERGVSDIKFCFAPLAEETVESVCELVNEALDAVEAREYDELPALGDSRRPNKGRSFRASRAPVANTAAGALFCGPAMRIEPELLRFCAEKTKEIIQEYEAGCVVPGVDNGFPRSADELATIMQGPTGKEIFHRRLRIRADKAKFRSFYINSRSGAKSITQAALRRVNFATTKRKSFSKFICGRRHCELATSSNSSKT